MYKQFQFVRSVCCLVRLDEQFFFGRVEIFLGQKWLIP